MQHDGKRKWFVMPPAGEVTVEPTAPIDVYAVLRDHMKYVELIHTELRQARHDKQELKMKVSELSLKVDTLISVATDLKGRVDAASSAISPGVPVEVLPVQDDPEVEALAHRIDDAIAVLKGEKHADEGVQVPAPDTSTVPPANAFPDPNSPAPSEPSDAAPAVDPNAPV